MSPTEDFYKGQVFYIELLNKFHVIDFDGVPKQGSWVVTERISNKEVSIERYRGQKYLGVVRVLKSYEWLSTRRTVLSVIARMVLIAILAY